MCGYAALNLSFIKQKYMGMDKEKKIFFVTRKAYVKEMPLFFF